jgi:hypothetical protein
VRKKVKIDTLPEVVAPHARFDTGGAKCPQRGDGDKRNDANSPSTAAQHIY